MKRRISIILATVLFLTIPAVALAASDISNALYYGIITITNSSTEATNVSTTASINTTVLIDNGYLNATADNVTIRNSAGTDMTFMPGLGGNPWVMWVPSIDANASFNYIVYTPATGGNIRYFPGTGGMTTIDSGTLELSDNFTVEQKGWGDTSSGANKDFVVKDDAFRLYISNSGKITAEIKGANLLSNGGFEDGDPPTGWTFTDGGGGTWSRSNEQVKIGTYSGKLTNGLNNYAIVHFKIDDASLANKRLMMAAWVYASAADKAYTNIRFHDNADAFISQTDSTAHTGDSSWQWLTATQTAPANTRYVYGRVFIPGSTPAGTLYCDGATLIRYAKATTESIDSGEHTWRSTADGTNLKIYVDDVEKASTALEGASVVDNDNNWTFLQNNVMPYMEFHKITISGVLQQHIIWEYDTTFDDLSAGNHDATPTFRTTSSDADVSAALVSFQPISEAQAPAYAVSDAPDFITTAPSISGNFTTTDVNPTFPGAGIIEDLAEAGNTPVQLPYTILAGFGILAVSLTTSWALKRFGSGSLVVKIIAIVAIMGILVAIQVFDLWLVIFFVLIAIAVAMASRHTGW